MRKEIIYIICLMLIPHFLKAQILPRSLNSMLPKSSISNAISALPTKPEIPYLEDKNQKANTASFMAAGGKERLVADLNELALSTQQSGGANPIASLNQADILAKDL